MTNNTTCKDCKHCEKRDFETRQGYAENKGYYCKSAQMRIDPSMSLGCFEKKEA